MIIIVAGRQTSYSWNVINRTQLRQSKNGKIMDCMSLKSLFHVLPPPPHPSPLCITAVHSPFSKDCLLFSCLCTRDKKKVHKLVDRGGLNFPMPVILSALAECFCKHFLPCFVFYGWGMGLGIVVPWAFIRAVPGIWRLKYLWRLHFNYTAFYLAKFDSCC